MLDSKNKNWFPRFFFSLARTSFFFASMSIGGPHIVFWFLYVLFILTNCLFMLVVYPLIYLSFVHLTSFFGLILVLCNSFLFSYFSLLSTTKCVMAYLSGHWIFIDTSTTMSLYTYICDITAMLIILSSISLSFAHTTIS